MVIGKVFNSLPCLTEYSPSVYGRDLMKSWFKGGDKRQLERILYNFIEQNSKKFDFLGITPLLNATLNYHLEQQIISVQFH